MKSEMKMPVSDLIATLEELGKTGDVSEKDIRAIMQKYNVVPDMLPQDVKDYLKHYPNTYYSDAMRSYCIHITCCEKCGNTHYLTVYVDGTYDIYDSRGKDISIRDFENFPNYRITNMEELREVLYLYENQPY